MTTKIARNTFRDGLVMDLAPDNTQNTCLTSALNATIITNNGNEFSLLNDMGNGRVETAFLPEGYVPVGTCEFGDIIYIVSYNPLTNKSQIGCFPSPERNISSTEIINLPNAMLSASDFLELDENGKPTGKLKSTSVRKVVYNKDLKPGDKYIIYDKNNKINLETYISDLRNPTHIFGHKDYKKYVNIHVVAIEESGKINYLDSSVHWYDDVDYYIQSVSETNIDIDSFRNATTSGYSIFSSKVSGKLALLVELEKINGFDCTYSLEEVESTNNFTKYRVKLNFDWSTDLFPPKYIVLTNLEFPGNAMYEKLIDWYITVGDDKTCILTDELIVPKQWKDEKTSPVYSFTITPAMEYGLLEEFSVNNIIDFSKVNKNISNLTEWRYYCQGNLLTLKLGLETYTAPGASIEKVTMDFYNHEGHKAVYTLEDKNSYSGIFTISIPLDDAFINNNLVEYIQSTDQSIVKGYVFKDNKYVPVTKKTGAWFFDDDNSYVGANPPIFIINNVSLKSSILYGVVIKVHYNNAVDIENLTFGAYMWTNSMMNLFYNNNPNFTLLDDPECLGLDLATITTTNGYSSVIKKAEKDKEHYKYNLNTVKAFINLDIIYGLTNTYEDTFIANDVDYNSVLESNVYKGESTYTKYSGQVKTLEDIHTGANDLIDKLNSETSSVLEFKYDNYKNIFTGSKEIEYANSLGELKSSHLPYYKINYDNGVIGKVSIPITIKQKSFYHEYFGEDNKEVPHYVAYISSMEDLSKFGLVAEDGDFKIIPKNQVLLALGCGEDQIIYKILKCEDSGGMFGADTIYSTNSYKKPLTTYSESIHTGLILEIAGQVEDGFVLIRLRDIQQWDENAELPEDYGDRSSELYVFVENEIYNTDTINYYNNIKFGKDLIQNNTSIGVPYALYTNKGVFYLKDSMKLHDPYHDSHGLTLYNIENDLNTVETPTGFIDNYNAIPFYWNEYAWTTVKEYDSNGMSIATHLLQLFNKSNNMITDSSGVKLYKSVAVDIKKNLTFMLGYKCNGKLHLMNNILKLYSNYRYYVGNKNRSLGLMLASVLNNLYYFAGNGVVNENVLKSIAYLDQYDIVYNTDLIYSTQCLKVDDYLKIVKSGYSFKDYKTKLQSYLPKEVTFRQSNINLKITPINKTIPLQFSIKYIQPDLYIPEYSAYRKCLTSQGYTLSVGASTNLLWFDDQSLILFDLSGAFKYKYVNYYTDNTYKLSNEVYSNPYLVKTFKYNQSSIPEIVSEYNDKATLLSIMIPRCCNILNIGKSEIGSSACVRVDNDIYAFHKDGGYETIYLQDLYKYNILIPEAIMRL